MTTQFYGVNVTGKVSGAGIKERVPVQTISLINQDLTTNLIGTAISGYTLISGDRFILAAQTTATQNGIYVAATLSVRAEDYESGDTSQCFVTVISGNYANTVWQATANGSVGTSTQGFSLIKYTVYSAGNIEYANSSNTRALLAPPGSTSFLQMTSSGIPSWNATVPVSNGGTGLNSITSGDLLIGNGTSALSLLTPTTYKMLVSDGTPHFTLSNNSYLTNISGATYAGNIITLTDASTGISTAANYLTFNNALTTSSPTIGVSGSDTNINLTFATKGTGLYDFTSTATTASTMLLHQLNGNNYIGLKAATSIPASLTFTLPSADGSSGQFLSTNGSGVLSFANSPTNIVNTSLLSEALIISNKTEQPAAYFCYVVARYGSGSTCKLYFESVVGVAFNVNINNVTTSTLISSTTISTSAFQTITFTGPTSDSRVSIGVIKNTSGTSPIIYGLQLGIN